MPILTDLFDIRYCAFSYLDIFEFSDDIPSNYKFHAWIGKFLICHATKRSSKKLPGLLRSCPGHLVYVYRNLNKELEIE